ncbi:protein MICROTUBULE BINDING PROTEIN 2C isoform X2 [Punica granatum]|uniref:Protein MICROTUBULE BINDING PROTEIN 2C isoform X2 n=1 Tax=Punica granatum TaxID=22663 RepID=A0A6P8BPE6_PUNGR|nr:protein MICROTUBULE BINDING PROTEIN 2C isoform X2 [Punica granatum]
MFEPQNFMDLQDNSGFGEPKSWLSVEAGDAGGVSSGSGRSLDRVLFNDLVEIVPLVQSLIVLESKGRNAAQSMPNKKKRDHGDKEQGKNGSGNDQEDGDNFLAFSSRGPAMEKEREELLLLRGQLEELQTQLSEKDDLLKSAAITQTKLETQLEELKRASADKDSFIKSIQLQLSDAKIKLADRQAALEKTQWEAMTSGKRMEKLQEELSNVQGEVSLIMSLFEGLKENDSTVYREDYDITPYCVHESSLIDDLDTVGIHRMEEARLAYIAAVAAAKERQDEESMAIAAKARLHLQSFIFGAEC